MVGLIAPTKQKGDLAELKVAADLLSRGHRIAFPFGDDWDYDLILCRGARLERVQVKHTRSNGRTMEVKCRSHSLTNGRIRRTKHYTAETIEFAVGMPNEVSALVATPEFLMLEVAGMAMGLFATSNTAALSPASGV